MLASTGTRGFVPGSWASLEPGPAEISLAARRTQSPRSGGALAAGRLMRVPRSQHLLPPSQARLPSKHLFKGSGKGMVPSPSPKTPRFGRLLPAGGFAGRGRFPPGEVVGVCSRVLLALRHRSRHGKAGEPGAGRIPPRFLGAGAWGAGQPRARSPSTSWPCARAGAGLEGARSCGTCSSGSLGAPGPRSAFQSHGTSSPRCHNRGAEAGEVPAPLPRGTFWALSSPGPIALRRTLVGRARRGEGQASERGRK